MTSIHQILPEHNFKFPPADGSTKRNFHRFVSFGKLETNCDPQPNRNFPNRIPRNNDRWQHQLGR